MQARRRTLNRELSKVNFWLMGYTAHYISDIARKAGSHIIHRNVIAPAFAIR